MGARGLLLSPLAEKSRKRRVCGVPMFLAQVMLPAAASALATPAPRTVVVAGATGRSGRLLVEELLKGETIVRALVRDRTKAAETLPTHPNLSFIDCDLASDTAAATTRDACASAHGLVWCASGFTSEGVSLDIKCMTELPLALKEAGEADARVVMLSSAGVTRTEWPEAKQEALVGAADIPIIRLNPGGILDRKREAEEILRSSGVPYAVVRPTGLKDDWPAGRPILSQGDVAVGRTAPADLARVLVSALTSPGSEGKTFEMFTLAGYPAPSDGLAGAFEALAADADGPVPEAQVAASYQLMQQLLPGEAQDATKLEMGQTYEQVDSGEVSRERGAAATERERTLAASAVDGITGQAPGKKRFFGLF